MPATTEEVVRAVHAVRAVALVLPCRVACLEESAAALLVLRSFGRSVRWCHGVAADPIRLHAWLETVNEVLMDAIPEEFEGPSLVKKQIQG